MATFLRRVLIVVVWAALFLCAYLLMSNRSEEDLQRLQKVLTTSQAWQSYQLSETFVVDGQEEVSIHAVSQENPRLLRVSSRIRLTDTEHFEFELYFSGEHVYIHTLNTDYWNRVNQNHPLFGELAGLTDPLAFWLRMLPHTAEIVPLSDNGYQLTLHPFRDEVHGMMFQDVVSATMRAYLADQQFGIKQLELDIHLKPNILRGHEHIVYTMTMSPLEAEQKLQLPAEALEAVDLE